MSSIFNFNNEIAVKNQQIFLPLLQEKEIELWVKREDTIHPFVSGNKYRKLKYNLLAAKKQNKKTLLTFGGAFSNNLLATAVAGKLMGFKTIGVVRGEELANKIDKNFTLQKAKENEMELLFVSRSEYRKKEDDFFLSTLQHQYGDFYLIPEGGTNELAIKGCEEIINDQDFQFHYICCCAGTGGTLSGLIKASKSNQIMLGFPALKGGFLVDEIKKHVQNKENWKLLDEYHFGGYADYSEKLINFINQFKETTQIALDPIYTGKMMFGILDLIGKNYFKKGTKILVIHTGGLQGIIGFNEMLKIKKSSVKIL